MNIRVLAGVASAWQFASWGGRISLLTEGGADRWDWIRIGTGLGLGVFLAVLALWKGATFDFQEKVASSFLFLSVIVWGRSLLTVWSETNTLSFRLVHTVLALVTFFLGVVLVRAVRETQNNELPTTS